MTGLEVYKDESGLIFHGCQIALRGKYLKVLTAKADLKNTGHFSKYFKKGGITLCLRGNWVISKEAKLIDSLNQQVINSLFPNASMQHFYFQQVDRGGHTYLSMIRKQEVEDLLAQLTVLGFEVLVLSLDSFITQDFMSAEEAKIDEGLLPAFASALQLLLKNEPIAIVHEEMRKSRMNFFAKTRFLGIAYLSAGVLLLLLLLNAVLYHYYAGLGQSAVNERSLNVAETGKFQQQEARISRQVAIIKSVGWTGGLRFAYLVDRMVAAMPYGIRVQEVSVNPIIERNRIGQSRSDSTKIKTIKVIGICKEASQLNNWIFALKENSWLQDCQIVNYSVNAQEQQANFVLNLVLKDHEE